MIKKKKIDLQIFLNLQNHPTFHSEKRLVNLERGREYFACLSKLLVYERLLDTLFWFKQFYRGA